MTMKLGMVRKQAIIKRKCYKYAIKFVTSFKNKRWF